MRTVQPSARNALKMNKGEETRRCIVKFQYIDRILTLQYLLLTMQKISLIQEQRAAYTGSKTKKKRREYNCTSNLYRMIVDATGDTKPFDSPLSYLATACT